MKNNYSITKPEIEWEGLTLDEIRYARALTQARIEISKEILQTRANAIYQGKSGSTAGRSMLGRMLGALSWLDYGLIALRVGAKAAGIFKKRR